MGEPGELVPGAGEEHPPREAPTQRRSHHLTQPISCATTCLGGLHDHRQHMVVPAHSKTWCLAWVEANKCYSSTSYLH